MVGSGLEGDRYCSGAGTFSKPDRAHRAVSLFEVEVLETIKRDHNTNLAPSECRMNLITTDVPLTHLVGRTFAVGAVVLRGTMLNEPCKHLENVVGRSLIPALVHRSGLFAEIVRGGTIHVGDKVVEFLALVPDGKTHN